MTATRSRLDEDADVAPPEERTGEQNGTPAARGFPFHDPIIGSARAPF